MILMPPAGSRKRPAPGTSPLLQQQQQHLTNINAGTLQMPADPNIQWNQPDLTSASNSYADPSIAFGSNMYNGSVQQDTPSNTASTQIARRAGNHHVVPRRAYNNGADESWSLVSEDTVPQSQDSAWLNTADDLEQKAQIARRDTQAKRKQIPPFVQKLSRFLDESRNTELIRWSANGDSFIVVDEDEFAKTLIPELFKHNNYASFVRQLNMYGFHKKVGLSDNSMRASERKNKSPSEYSNQYFKRGRPNLLWLVQKPKNPQGKSGGKGGGRIKQEDANPDDDGEEAFDSDTPTPMNHGSPEKNQPLRNGRHQLRLGEVGNVLPQEELANVRRELQVIRQQQQVISNMLHQTREQHKQLYGQAAAFQNLHDRHESSINAILTFLATVYNRSLEGQGGPNFSNMFAGAIPHDNQGQGNVVDVGEYQDERGNTSGQPQRNFRRQPLLLKAPPANFLGGQTSSPSPNSVANSPLVRSQQMPLLNRSQAYPADARAQVAQSPAVQTLSEIHTPSNRSSQSPQVGPVSQDSDMNQIPEADILSMINSANASHSPFSNGKAQMNFPDVFSRFETAEGQSPMTANERNNMLQLMANGSAAATQNGINSALTFPMQPEVAPMQQYNSTKDQMDFIGNSLKDQDQKVNELSYMLAPLSPSGSIPGLSDPQGFNGEMLDLDQIFNSGDYFDDVNRPNLDFSSANNDGLNDFLFDNPTDMAPSSYQDPSQSHQDDGGAGGSVVGTINSSETTSPANTIDENLGGLDERGSPERKRKRKS